MANLRIDLQAPIIEGQTLTFKSPVDCSQVTGLIVYYPEDDVTVSKVFQFADAHGNDIGDLDLFASDSLVKVILHVPELLAFVQNADTNAYLEQKFVDVTLYATDPNNDGNIVLQYGGNVVPGGGGSGGSGGIPGADGFSPIATVVSTEDGALITITDKNGTTEVAVPNGRDGADGKSAYQYAKDGGFEGTEEEFAEKMAADFPKALKNPHALTINGTSYDGSESVDVTIQGITIKDDGNGNVEIIGGGTGGSGGVSSWNDLTDKPFDCLEELLPETAFQYDSDLGFFFIPSVFDFKYGENYIVNWNGVEYTVTATIGFFADPFYGTNIMPIVVLGNPAPLGAPEGVVVENNGLPFAIASVGYMNATGAIPLDGSTAVTVSIYGTKKLDPYWNNGAYILNIEATDTKVNSGGIPFTFDTTELAMAILHNRPIHINLTINQTNNGYTIGQGSVQLFATAVSLMGGKVKLQDYILLLAVQGLLSTIPMLRIDSWYMGKGIYFYSDHYLE